MAWVYETLKPGFSSRRAKINVLKECGQFPGELSSQDQPGAFKCEAAAGVRLQTRIKSSNSKYLYPCNRAATLFSEFFEDSSKSTQGQERSEVF